MRETILSAELDRHSGGTSDFHFQQQQIRLSPSVFLSVSQQFQHPTPKHTLLRPNTTTMTVKKAAVILLALCLATSTQIWRSEAKYSSKLQGNTKSLSSVSFNSKGLTKKHIVTKHRKVKGAPEAIIEASAATATSSSNAVFLRGLGCIIGGAIAHLTFGTMYCWGNFLSYAPDYLKFFDGKLHPGTPPDALYVLPLTLVAQALAMPFGPTLTKAVGASRALLIGSWITALGTYVASYQKSLLPFVLSYSLLFGAGVGLGYTAPMAAGWKWLPDSKGLVSGGILAGFGAGGFIFSLIGSKIANPNQLNTVNGKFDESVYASFPGMLRKLAMLYAVTALVGSLLISEPKEAAAAAKTPASGAPPAAAAQGLSVAEALKTSQFWLMWTMVISSATTGLNTASIYKQFAATSPALVGDGYQTLVGGIGALFNGGGRLFWGIITDQIGFKNSFTILTLLQMVLMLTYQHSAQSKLLFAANTCLIYFCLAGNLALMPPATQRMFGSKAGTVIYGVLFSAFAIASVLGGYLTKALVQSFGYGAVFKIMAGMSVLATLLVSQLLPVSSFPASTV